MRKAILACTLLAALVLTACSTSGSGGGGGANSSTISMGFGSFTGNTSITVKAGDSVTFDDSSGSAHQLVIGTGGNFVAQSGAPSQLNNATGVMFNGGDTQHIVFPTAGTYQITCRIHPSMQATVTVTS